MKLKKATMVYKSLYGLASEYLFSKFALWETAYNLRDSENKLYHGQIITKIALAIVAPSYGKNSRVKRGKKSPLRNSDVFLNKYARA